MVAYIVGFIVAVILAVFVIAWIAYCMFVREKHKSELYHHNISDIQRRNQILDQTMEKTSEKTKDISVGVFVLPGRRKQKDESFVQRPDYPESSITMSHNSTEKLIEILNADDYRDGISDHNVCHNSAPCDTDV